jgi:hypothetical protein
MLLQAQLQPEPGVPLALTINVIDATNDCTPLGYQITGTDRGIKTTAVKGQVSFATIWPGWYTGRAIHIHVRVRKLHSSGATVAGYTTQIFFSDAANDAIFAGAAPYNTRGPQDDGTTDENDSVLSTADDDTNIERRRSARSSLSVAAITGQAGIAPTLVTTSHPLVGTRAKNARDGAGAQSRAITATDIRSTAGTTATRAVPAGHSRALRVIPKNCEMVAGRRAQRWPVPRVNTSPRLSASRKPFETRLGIR